MFDVNLSKFSAHHLYFTFTKENTNSVHQFRAIVKDWFIQNIFGLLVRKPRAMSSLETDFQKSSILTSPL